VWGGSRNIGRILQALKLPRERTVAAVDRIAGERRSWPLKAIHANIRSCHGFAAPTAPTGPNRGTGSTARIRKIRMLSAARRAASGAIRAIRRCGLASDPDATRTEEPGAAA
jgi:hypothetical protein